jgi:Fe-S-cluster-containing dehydrogenase component
MIRIQQHRYKCIGCNACVEADKYRWRISKKDGKSTLVGGTEKKGWFSAVVENKHQGIVLSTLSGISRYELCLLRMFLSVILLLKGGNWNCGFEHGSRSLLSFSL